MGRSVLVSGGAAGARTLPRRLAWIALAALIACAGRAAASNSADALNYYGLVTLSDEAVGARLAARFKAKGQPVFLVHDVNAGLGQNDIMRFSDKAVLVDGAVWSTLQAEGALGKLRAAPLVRVQARANSGSWEQRGDLVTGERQRKAYKLGAELLRTLEENFGGTPLKDQLTVVFEQGHLTLLAPSGLLDQLRFVPVRRVAPAGQPRIVSPAPDSIVFLGQPFEHAVWAADPTDPSGDLAYSLIGDLPPGLTWNAADHTLRGKPAAPGRWRLVAQARNAGGLRDTASFVLRVRANQAPLLIGDPPIPAVAGRPWRFDPKPTDLDHPAYALTVSVDSLPAGMRFDRDSLSLRWLPDTASAGTRPALVLSVSDPLGGKKTYRHEIPVITQRALLLSEGVKLDVPWDTLVQGRSHVWKLRALRAAWAGQNIALRGVEGSDSTRLSGDSLRVRPVEAGTHTITFRFTVQDAPVSQSVSVPVRPDNPPEFVTEVNEWMRSEGSPPRRYRPVAIDPEGEAVSITARFPESAPLQWDGRHLTFTPERTGIYPVLFTARDPGGKTAEQWVTYGTNREGSGMRWILENRVHGEFTTWTAMADFGTGRIGFYSPNFTYGVVPSSYWMYRQTPYLVFGGNLMGRRNEALDRRLWVDVGIAFGYPAPQVVTGGLYARVNGEWHFPSSPFSWIEMELTAHAHQAMFATDSATLSALIRDSTDIINRETLSRKGILSRMIMDGFRHDNLRVFSRFEAFGALGWGFYAGPSLWREDDPIRQSHVQRLGLGLRYRLSPGDDVYQLTGRIGWSPSGEGVAAYGSMRLSFSPP